MPRQNLKSQNRLALESASGVDASQAAIAVLLGFVALSAYGVWSAAGQARETLETKEALAYFITDNGIKSDNQEAEADLAAAAAGLIQARKVALCLFVGAGLVAISLIIRLSYGRNRPQNTRA